MDGKFSLRELKAERERLQARFQGDMLVVRIDTQVDLVENTHILSLDKIVRRVDLQKDVFEKALLVPEIKPLFVLAEARNQLILE